MFSSARAFPGAGKEIIPALNIDSADPDVSLNNEVTTEELTISNCLYGQGKLFVMSVFLASALI